MNILETVVSEKFRTLSLFYSDIFVEPLGSEEDSQIPFKFYYKGENTKDNFQFTDGEVTTVIYKVTTSEREKMLILGTMVDGFLLKERNWLSFTEFSIMERLFSDLLGEKVYIDNVRNDYKRHLLLVTFIILQHAEIQSNLFRREESFPLKEFLVKHQTCLSFWKVNSINTYNSRKNHYRPDRYLTISVINPLTEIEEESSRPYRYSSYCKGYGESAFETHKEKTRYSAELDGMNDPEFFDYEILWIIRHLTNSLNISIDNFLLNC